MKQLNYNKSSKFKLYMQSLCWKLNDILQVMRKKLFCYYNIDMEEIKREVETTYKKAEKFEEAKEVLVPKVLETVEKLNFSEEQLQSSKTELEFYIKREEELKNIILDLYIADVSSDLVEKHKLFKEFFELYPNILKGE